MLRLLSAMQAADELTMNIVDVEAGKLLMNAVRPVTDITCRHLHEVIHNFLQFTHCLSWLAQL